MKTQTKTLHLQSGREEDIKTAGAILKNGGLVAIPTETVYGLAANALDSAAVISIFAAKGRPADNPLIVHISHLDQWAPLVAEIPPAAQQLAQAFWPGPLTIILPKSPMIPDAVSAGQSTVAVRFPSHPVARAVIDAAGVPLAAPSANLSGSPSPTRAAHVIADLEGRIDAVLDGGSCEVGLESTVVTLAEGVPRILRPGGITPEQLRQVLGTVEVDSAVLNPLKEGEKVLSPGTKYKHYSPKADVLLLQGHFSEYRNYVMQHTAPGAFALCYEGEAEQLSVPAVTFGAQQDVKGQAQRLFDALRQLDAEQATVVYARCPEPQGVGLAVYNRLIRAAGFKVVHLD